MRSAVRACMVGLVLVNLGFVHITEASRLSWLAPLVGLTLFSPWLRKLTRFWTYRALWNLAVLGAFASLVNHVTYAGVAFLLEDGLLLAALCQVHLINNLSDTQKPDLIFFNSFLIAVVTSYLSLDLGYSVVFLLYAPLFVVALQLLAVTRAGASAEEERAAVGPVVWSGLKRSAAVVGLTLLVFFFLPRDFNRKGLLGDSLHLAPPASMTEVAFSEQVDLEQSGSVLVSDRVVMTVRGEPGARFGLPAYWRGATLDEFDGRTWRPTRKKVFSPRPWRRTGPASWVRGSQNGAGAWRRLEAHLADPNASRVFVPLQSRRVAVDTARLNARQRINELPDGNFRRVAADRRPLHYVLDVTREPPELGGRQAPLVRAIRAHIGIVPSLVPRRAREIARTLRRQLPDDVEQHRIVSRLSRYLTANYRYLAPGAEGGANTLEEFLAGDAAAHCEYFATALAVMLRAERIPCRVVTGYRSEEWDEKRGILTIRARHAHAWVEVLDPEGGWYTVDPTPAVGASADSTAGGLLARAHATLSGLWAKITGFNAATRAGVFAWLRAVPRRTLDHPGATALCLAGLILALAALRLRRRSGEPAAVRHYRKLVAKLGLALEPAETPRELLARVRRTAFPAARLERLEDATTAHERTRYDPVAGQIRCKSRCTRGLCARGAGGDPAP